MLLRTRITLPDGSIIHNNSKATWENQLQLPQIPAGSSLFRMHQKKPEPQGEPVAWDIEQVIYQFNRQCFDFQFAWQKGLGQNIEPQIAPQCIH